LGVVDAVVVTVCAADSLHDAFDDLFLEGLVLVLRVLGARSGGGEQEADTEGSGGEFQGARQRSRRYPCQGATGFGLAHRFTCPKRERERLIGWDQGAFAAGSPPKQTNTKAITPPTNTPPPRTNPY